MHPRFESVSEITGPYGDYSVTEKVIQRLWGSGYFIGRPMRTLSGKNLVLTNPGKINPHEGPDFREGAWELDGKPGGGDAEIHFHERDWYAHGHDRAPEFARVALHILVFPPARARTPAQTGSGEHPETLVLLAHLPEDLESLAEEDALMRADGRETDALAHRLQALPPEELRRQLTDASRARHEQKLERVRRRIDTLGPERALHLMLLEGLGARRNRTPMAELAERHAPDAFAQADPHTLFQSMEGRWKLAGVRPANHPKTRLVAYANLLRTHPGWQRDALAFFRELPVATHLDDTRVFRHEIGLTRIQKNLTQDILRNIAGTSRVNTLAVDAIIPWAELLTGRDLAAHWHHWPLGDAPENTGPLLRRLRITDLNNPAANGHFQGLIGIALNAG